MIAGRVALEGRARLCREHCGRDAPPGSAGVSPACTAAAYRAERPRWCTRQPRRQKRREPGQSRALVRLPVESRWREGPGCAENTAEETPHPGARASRPHALPLRFAQFPCDSAPGHPAGGNPTGPAQAEPWRDCRSSRVGGKGQTVPRTLRKRRPTRERGRLARMHCRSVSLRNPPTPPAETA